jgi:carboxylesterase type B
MNVSEKLPVVVQIHGGGYTRGDSQSYPGHALVRHSQNSIIYVSIQYRLGAYGFLYPDDDEYAANLGLQDQRHALLWVKHHISAFGGDAEKVTIVGGSAGGGSVTSLMIMFGGKEEEERLFRAAVAEYPWWQPYLTKPQLATQYRHLLTAAGCNNTSCLRSLSEDALAIAAQGSFITAYAARDYGYGSFYYGPYVDGLVIQDLPSREFERGNYVKVPLLTNRETFEGQSFSNRTGMSEEEEVGDLKALLPLADQEFVEKVWEFYPRGEFNGSSFDRRVGWFSDVEINCPTYYISSSMANAGQNVWKMIFNAGSQRHAATSPFLYNLDFGSSPTDNTTLASIMKDWILSFVVDLDPNSRSWSNFSKPVWPTYAETGGDVVTVNFTSMGLQRDPDDGERCRFLRESAEIVQN